ncbi:hypothetical protein [Mycobacterium sp.]|uniref:hypothetical protein n=1 Tax=Mycobacterium sp. TaxID=1785 RepID=UPI003BAE23B6
MPASRAPRSAAVVHRVPGLYAGLLERQEAAVIKPDERTFDWDTTVMATFAQSRTAAAAAAKIQPKRSTLLDKLRRGEPVVVEGATAREHLPANPPDWLKHPRALIRVYPDDLVEPAGDVEHADQCQW